MMVWGLVGLAWADRTHEVGDMGNDSLRTFNLWPIALIDRGHYLEALRGHRRHGMDKAITGYSDSDFRVLTMNFYARTFRTIWSRLPI